MRTEPIQWRHLKIRPKSIDFKELGLEDILIILWKASTKLSDDIIPVNGTDEEMFNKAQEAIVTAKPFKYTVTLDDGNTETWYFKKWIEEFNGKKIKTDLSDPSRMCPIWYDEMNDKENYMEQISKTVLDKLYRRKNIKYDY